MNLALKILAPILALICSSSTLASVPQPLTDTYIQGYLNDTWSGPLLNAYIDATCGNQIKSQKSLSSLTTSTPSEILASPVTYGFVLGYNNHLSSLESNLDPKATCKKADLQNQDGKGVSSEQAIATINESLKLESHLGEERAKSLMISLYNINNTYSKPLSKRLLLDACGLNSAVVPMPSILEIVNASRLSVAPKANDIKDIAQAWKGYSQGMYWHALSLIEKLSDKPPKEGENSPRTVFCSQIQ